MNYFSAFVDPQVYSTTTSGDGYVTCNIGKTGLLKLLATNQVSSTRFVQIFDAAATPSPGASPLAELQVAGNTQGSLDFLVSHWLPLVNGLVIVSSTTSATYTAGGNADLFLNVLFIYR
jgi:hypothetical protein